MRNKLLSVKEYAIAEGVETSAIYNRIARDTLKSIKKHGLTWVYPNSDKTGKVGRPKK